MTPGRAGSAGADVAAAQPDVDALVSAAAAGDSWAWEDLVRRLMPVVASTIGEFGLSGADAAEINQTVWLRVVEWLEHLRQPAALPSWIATTTRRECQRVLRTSRHTRPVGLYGDLVGQQYEVADPVGCGSGPEDAALDEERFRILREGFALLPARCRALLAMLLDEPPMSYREIVAQTGMRIGSIGPTQRRCLDKLRATPALAAYLDAGQEVRG
jgi:RNA polymerase sigma factor (sigma-70 family)